MSMEWISRLTWEQADAMDREQTLCILPVSALEQHGRHLPLGTDDVILLRSLEALAERYRDREDPVLVYPPVHYGNSAEHVGFCGTASLRLETLLAVIRDVVSSIAESGFSHVLLLNSHGGNSALLEAMAQELHADSGVRLFCLNYWASDFFGPAAALIKTPLSDECHAGEIETSLLLHWQPETVSMEGLSRSDLRWIPGFHPLDKSWLTADISPHGVMGDAAAASPETGAALAALLADQLERAVDSILREIRPSAG